MLLFDEADQYIFDNPSEFSKFIEARRCLCLTGTPDNQDAQGIERCVLEKMKFAIFEGVKAAPLDYQGVEHDVLSVVLQEIQHCSVLLYCCPLTVEQLVQSKVPFKQLAHEGQIDVLIKNLDIVTLIVATDPLFMRGFDYRAPRAGITLVIACPFEN